MPPAPMSKNATQSAKAERHVEAAYEFVSELYKTLSSDPKDMPATDELVDQINRHVEKLHACQEKYLLGYAGDPEIDGMGTQLWNLCTRLRREFDPAEKRLRRLVLHGRVLAFHLLVIAKQKDSGKAPDLIRMLKLALKAARDCIDSSEHGLATPVLQTAADYKGSLQDIVSALPENVVKECNRLEVEYFIVRTALSWAENRLDVAEHMYTKTERLRHFLTPDYAEKLADVLYEIGKSLTARSDFIMAVKWLERAQEMINGQNIESLSRDGIELRLAILQALVTALLGTDSAEGLDKAKNWVNYIESEVGNRLVVLLLRLELLQKTPAEVFDSDAYADVLRRIIRSIDLTDSGFKLIIFHIRKLHDKSPGAGCAILDDFILTLRATENDDWMEKAVITRVWMITYQRDSVKTTEAVDGVLSQLTKPLSAEATAAALTLIWKKLETSYGMGEYDMAENWCRLLLHSVFQNCGPSNTSKLERKLLLCALARNNLDAAILVIQSMSAQSWKEPMTAYLAFKVAIRTEDRALAERCLDTVCLAPDHIEYLGACIAESQKVGDISSAVAALKKLRGKHEYKEPNPIYLPALFRCIIRLLNILADKPNAEQDGVVNSLCREFENVAQALEHQKQDPGGTKLFNIDEIEWFSGNSYNLALKNTTTWDLRCVVRMLTACVNIISYIPSDRGSAVEVSLKTLFSRFIIASALISLARTEDNVEKQQNDFLAMRAHIKAFDDELTAHLANLDEKVRDDMVRKQATLFAFDFEGAVCLGQFEDLGSIVQRAVACGSIIAFQAMADCLLRAQVPGQVLYSNMRKIVNEIWSIEGFDGLKLARYTRCLFQATLPLNDALAMKLLDEACGKARELRESEAGSEARWPEEETEWMATTAFNHAIDCYGCQEEEKAKEWATKAINLAHYCDDGGGLEKTLQSKYLSLNFDRN
ncbi:meiosis protein SPO22/ZIP4 like-domain-containing protein [Cercophora scortea]|uniref:Meiosis protein SPO22/ZIP4 like-domain-containing protein n=1 Tax=Cercophora scortea TaxID=314031 RepID=A0AAE0M6S3_9PEZI|nr:meiosis protein SPO22/ZIP4 like-domain-containing protein [Cercophora scortea]